jgi:hypothetical protein
MRSDDAQVNEIEALKEMRRRQKIADKNQAWQCGHGLVPCLEASIDKKPVVYKPVPGGRRQPVVESSGGEFAEKLEKAIEEKFGRQS